VATAIIVILFVITGTNQFTDDRGRALASIAANVERIDRLEKSDAAIENLLCVLKDEIKANYQILQTQMHSNDIASTEIKVRLTAVEAILTKIDQKLEER